MQSAACFLLLSLILQIQMLDIFAAMEIRRLSSNIPFQFPQHLNCLNLLARYFCLNLHLEYDALKLFDEMPERNVVSFVTSTYDSGIFSVQRV